MHARKLPGQPMGLSTRTPGKRIILPLILLLVTACSYTSVREHKDFREIAKHIDSVVIAPPSVTAELIVFSGENERLRDKEATVGPELASVATGRLQELGLHVMDFDFERTIAEDEEFAYALTQCREAYRKAHEDLYNGRMVQTQDKATFQSSIGSVVNVIAERTGADSLLLMDYYGFEKSEGMIAKDMAAGVLLALLTGTVVVQPANGSVLNIALIDTTAGDVLWTNVKSLPQIDASIAVAALEEFPLMSWKPQPAIAGTPGNTLQNIVQSSPTNADLADPGLMEDEGVGIAGTPSPAEPPAIETSFADEVASSGPVKTFEEEEKEQPQPKPSIELESVTKREDAVTAVSKH